MNNTTKPLNIVAIIPARYASTRLPIKPLVDLWGKPMIQRVYEQTKKSSLVNRVIVATDHGKIVETVKRFGGEAILTSVDCKSGSDRIAHAARDLDDADIIVNVQGDEPLIAPQMIDETITPLIQDSAIHVSTAVKKITNADDIINPNIVKVVIDKEGFAIYFSRSPIPYLRNGLNVTQWHLKHSYFKHFGLYVFRKEFLLKFSSWGESKLEQIEKLEQLRIIENGYKIKTVITEYDSISVDTEEDAVHVRNVIKLKGVD
ncbi:MAG: 3-deoxy-manno-octulosonate cytidylyltransferase [Bacteroidota bacterium]|nr:3-deoxy-manno-octulosonate cytidylyltransferase [Bacteroidota bacterium]